MSRAISAGQALGEHEALQRLEVGLHPLGIHHETGGDPLEGIERAAGGVHQLGNGHQLGLPAAERALVLADAPDSSVAIRPGARAAAASA